MFHLTTALDAASGVPQLHVPLCIAMGQQLG